MIRLKMLFVTTLLVLSMFGATSHAQNNHSGIYIGAGGNYYFDSEVKNDDGLGIYDDYTDAFIPFSSDDDGVSLSLSALTLKHFNSRLVTGLEIQGEFGEDITAIQAMARVGYAFNNFIPYLHAGVGYEEIDYNFGPFDFNDDRFVGRFGTGLHILSGGRWSMDLNYTYVFGEDETKTIDGSDFELESDRHVTGFTVRYKL